MFKIFTLSGLVGIRHFEHSNLINLFWLADSDDSEDLCKIQVIINLQVFRTRLLIDILVYRTGHQRVAESQHYLLQYLYLRLDKVMSHK